MDRDNLISLVYPRPPSPDAAPQLPEAAEPGSVVTAGDDEPSVKGAVSIQVYGLNRLGLVQARTRVLRDLEFLLDMSVSLGVLMEEVKERKEREDTDLKAMKEAGTPDQAAHDRLADDLALDTRLETNLRHYRDALLDRIREMTADHAPYSAVARAWVRAYRDS